MKNMGVHVVFPNESSSSSKRIGLWVPKLQIEIFVIRLNMIQKRELTQMWL